MRLPLGILTGVGFIGAAARAACRSRNVARLQWEALR